MKRFFKKSVSQKTAILLEMEKALPMLRSFAKGLSASNTVADDLVQSSVERALNRLDQVTNPAGVKSWLFRIIYTQWQDTLRRRQRRKAHLFLLNGSQSEAFTSKSNANESTYIAKLDVRKALDKLSDEHRSAVVLVSMLGYGYKEASEILEIPPGTVASRVARARTILAGFLTMEKRNNKKKLVGGE